MLDLSVVRIIESIVW